MPRRYVLLLALVCALVTVVVYGRALTLPLYMDDVIFARYIDPLTLPEIFYRVDIVPYYRPLSLVPWEALHNMSGRYDRFWMHAFNLIVHAANGALVGMLAWRIAQPEPDAAGARGGRPTPLISAAAALVYLLFPFSYQAVPWAAALGHLMATLGALAALNALEAWWRARSRFALVCVWLGVATAVFSHENGAASALLLCLPFALNRGRARQTRRMLLALAPAFAIVVVFALVWLALPKERDALALNLSDMAANYAYFAQGIGFPLAQAGGALAQASGANRALIAVGLSATAAGIAWWAAEPRRALRASNTGDAAWSPSRRVCRFGLLWYGIAISVPAALLPARYAIDGPRLMLLASVGAALVWAAAAEGLLGWHRARTAYGRGGRSVRAVTALGLLAFILITSADFIGRRMALHDIIAPAYDRMLAQTGRTAFVNLPAWLAYDQTTYALGSEGVTYMTDYIGFPDLVFTNTGVWRETAVTTAEAIRDPVPGHYWAALAYGGASSDVTGGALNHWGGAYALQWAGGAWRWACADRLNMRVDVPSPCLRRPLGDAVAAFQNEIALMPVAAYREGTALAVELAWVVGQPADVTAFVHLVCGSSDVPVAQADGVPLRGLLPFAAMRSGDAWRERRYLDVPEGQALDGCAVRIGLYDPATGARVPLADGGEWAAMAVEGAES